MPGPEPSEPSLHPPCMEVRAPRAALAGAGRLRLGLRTALVAIQVVYLTLVGWIGATLTLLPLALRGAPVGRTDWSGRENVIRLLGATPPREAVPR